MVFRKAIRLFSILILLLVFVYWTITAYGKYLDQPTSTTTEYRLGDDDMGNLTLPIFTFCTAVGNQMPKCKLKHQKKLLIRGAATDAAVECMKEYDDINEFYKAISYNNPIKRKSSTKVHNRFKYTPLRIDLTS